MTFDEWCKAHNTTPEQSLLLSKSDRDLIGQPAEDHMRVHTGLSKIHGTGIFAARDFGPHTFVGQALDQRLHRTAIIGRYINHSHTPNCYLKRYTEPVATFGGTPIVAEPGYGLFTLFEVAAGTELTMTYEACDLIRKGQL